MKKFPRSFFTIVIIAASFSCQAQTTNNIEGVWKGTSLCQSKPSPCNDENVVYHITKGKDEKTYVLQMNKMVNGVEEEMGPLTCVYDPEKKLLTGQTSDRKGRPGNWVFKIDGKQIHGTLTVGENMLYRLIEVKKSESR